MAKVFIVGYSIPKYSPRGFSAVNYRTWQFVKPLLSDGHTVRLCAVCNGNFDPIKVSEQNLQCYFLNIKKNSWCSRLQKIYNEFDGDCIVGVGSGACFIASFLKNDKPIWMDIYGDPVMENQIRLYSIGDNRGLFSVIGMENAILRKGDVFSGLSNPQKYAVIGKLGMMGRLNRESMGYEFVHTIFPGMENEAGSDTANEKEKILRCKLVEKDDFIVLWCGGYNAWADVEILFKGLEYAMERNPKIKFVSIGVGAIVDPHSYPRFLANIKNSKHKEKFVMCGWLPSHEDVFKYYRESDIGISTDKNCYETLIGSRTRFVEMLTYGLPVITTAGCELGYILENEGVCRTVPTGDFASLGKLILKLAERNLLKDNLAKKYQNLIQKFSFETTISPLRKWILSPLYAPDKRMRKLLKLKEKLRWLVRRLMIKTAKKMK